MTINQLFKEIRERKKISQKKMATLLGVHEKTVMNYEKDGAGMKLEALLNLKRVFPEVDLNWFASGEIGKVELSENDTEIDNWSAGDKKLLYKRMDYLEMEIKLMKKEVRVLKGEE